MKPQSSKATLSLLYSFPHNHKCASHDDNHSPSPTRAQDPRLLNLPQPTTTTHASATCATTCRTPHAFKPQDDLRPEPQSHPNGRVEPGKLCVHFWRNGWVRAEEGDGDTGSGAAVRFTLQTSFRYRHWGQPLYSTIKR